MIHGFTAAYSTMRINVAVKAFRQIGEELFFPFAILTNNISCRAPDN